MNAYRMNNGMPAARGRATPVAGPVAAPAAAAPAAAAGVVAGVVAGVAIASGLPPGIRHGDSEGDSGNRSLVARGCWASLAVPLTGRRPTCSLPAQFSP